MKNTILVLAALAGTAYANPRALPFTYTTDTLAPGQVEFEQTVGANPFNFFDPKNGVRLGIGNPLRGTNVQLFAGLGHELPVADAERGDL